MKNLLTKHGILAVSGAYIFFLGILYGISLVMPCPEGPLCNREIGNMLSLAIFSLSPLLLLLPFSIVTYKMRDEVFEYWRNFSLWYLPVLIIFALMLTNGGHGGDFAGVVSGWFNGVVILVLAVIYALISICLIIKKRADFKK